MKNPMPLFVFVLLLGTAGPALAEPENQAAIFQKANEAYRGGDYPEAARLYESLVTQGARQADIYYNLGNAYFKQKKIGLALLNYERAKRLEPRDRDIRADLAFSRSLLEYRVEDKRNWYLKMGEIFLETFTREEIALAALAFILLFWLSWAVQLFFRPLTSWGRPQRVFFLAAFSFACLWVSKEIYSRTVQEALALQSQAAVRYGPSHKDQIAFRLGEGIKVRLKKRTGEWSQVLLTNGETGWMANEEIGVI